MDDKLLEAGELLLKWDSYRRNYNNYRRSIRHQEKKVAKEGERLKDLDDSGIPHEASNVYFQRLTDRLSSMKKALNASLMMKQRIQRELLGKGIKVNVGKLKRYRDLIRRQLPTS